MADDILIKIGVVETGIEKATSGMTKLESRIKSTVKAFESGRTTNQQFETSLKEIRRSVDSQFPSWQKAKGAIDQYAKAVSNAKKNATLDKEFVKARKEAEAYDKELESLSQRFKPLYAVSKQYENSLNATNKAHKIGVLNTKQHKLEIDRLNKEYAEFNAGTAKWTNQFVQGSGRAGKSMNKFGMYAQQVGYQVGDFFVQVQSGQSALVAFGQQGTQLAGLLPGVAGAVVGISLAIGTTLVGAYLRARNGAEDFVSSFEDMDDALSSMKSTQEILKTSVVDLIGQYGFLANEVKDAAKEILKLDLAKSLSFEDMPGAGPSGFGAGIASMFGNDFMLLTKELSKLETQQAKVSEGFNLWNYIGDDTVGRISDRVEILSDRLGLAGDEFKNLLDAGIAFQNAKTVEDQAKAAINLAKEMQKVDENIIKQNGDLGAVYNTFIRLVPQAAELLNVVGDTKDEVRDVSSNANLISFDNAITSANGLFGALQDVLGVIGGILGAIGSIGFENIGKKATVSALRAGKSKGQAAIEGKLAEERARLETSGIGQVGINAVLLTKRKAMEEGLGYDDEITKLSATKTKGGRGGGGGGASKIEGMADAYGKLMDRLNGVDPLITKFNDEVAKLQKWQESGAISMEQYSTAVALLKEELIAAQDPLASFRKKLEEALDPEKNYAKSMESLHGALSDFLFNPFEDGVKGMVRQFSDALRRMASDAIAAAIMQKIIGGVGGGGGGGGIGALISGLFANGGAFSGGSQITAFANGGVVGGPTVFPMANGAGLMGEAGPEAIMPLKRGSNGKLGVEVSNNNQSPKQDLQVKVINVDDRSSIGQYLNSPAGEKIVMNVLRRNGMGK